MNPELRLPVRFDYQTDSRTDEILRNRYQYQFTLRAGLHLFEFQDDARLALKTTIGTGSSYTSQWNTLYDIASGETGDQVFHARQFYVVLTHPMGRIETGVIPPVKGKVSHTSIDKDGWIRGGRVVIALPRDGALECVTGGIDKLDSPNAFQTWHRWNYHELEWSQPWHQALSTELGANQLGADRYVRAELATRLFTGTDVKVDARGEILRHLGRSEWASDASVSLRTQRLKIEMEYSFVPSTFGLLGTLVNDFFTLGHIAVLRISGAIGAQHQLRWFGRSYWGEARNRLVVGLAYAFGP